MPFDPNPTGDLKGDLNFQELARGLDQIFEGGVTINDLDVDVDFLVNVLSGVVGLFVDGTNGRVGIGTASPSNELHIQRSGNVFVRLASTGTGMTQFILADASQDWRFGKAGDDTFTITDNTGGAVVVRIQNGAPANALFIQSSGYIVLGAGSPRFVGRTSTAADPTTTELPVDKDFGLHKNTASGAVFLAYNDGGAIKKVALT